MKVRLNAPKAAPEAFAAMVELENVIRRHLDPALLDLVKLRASQINGCAYCIHMHATDARARGESEERLYLLDAWRESPLYSPRERAALAWTEAVTRIGEGHAPDAVYDGLPPHFSEAEIANLTAAIAMINLWNRMAIALRTQHPVKAGTVRS